LPLKYGINLGGKPAPIARDRLSATIGSLIFYAFSLYSHAFPGLMWTGGCNLKTE
jgi:hypothetical protein